MEKWKVSPEVFKDFNSLKKNEGKRTPLKIYELLQKLEADKDDNMYVKLRELLFDSMAGIHIQPYFIKAWLGNIDILNVGSEPKVFMLYKIGDYDLRSLLHVDYIGQAPTMATYDKPATKFTLEECKMYKTRITKVTTNFEVD